MDFLEGMDETDELTMYTADEVFKARVGNIQWFFSYYEMCDEWFNTGIQADDFCYRDADDMEQMEKDKREFYDYKKKLWFFAD